MTASLKDTIRATRLGYPIHIGCGAECLVRTNEWQPLWTCSWCRSHLLPGEIAHPIGGEGFCLEDLDAAVAAERERCAIEVEEQCPECAAAIRKMRNDE